MTESIEANKQVWEESQAPMSKYYDKKHKKMSYKVGDMVMLASKHIRMRRASKKLADKYLGPFEVEEAIDQNAYKLKPPEKYGRIHATFHVSLLEPYHRRDRVKTPKPVDIIEGDEYLEVERVLDERVRNGKRSFLVR